MMMRRGALSLAAVTLLLACGAPATSPTPAAARLIVRNSGAFDAIIYVVRDAGGLATRLGSVRANVTQAFDLRPNQMSSSNMLTLRVRLLGTSTSWTSAAVIVQPQTVPVLDLALGPKGECSVCSLDVVTSSAALGIVRRDRQFLARPDGGR